MLHACRTCLGDPWGKGGLDRPRATGMVFFLTKFGKMLERARDRGNHLSNTIYLTHVSSTLANHVATVDGP